MSHCSTANDVITYTVTGTRLAHPYATPATPPPPTPPVDGRTNSQCSSIEPLQFRPTSASELAKNRIRYRAASGAPSSERVLGRLSSHKCDMTQSSVEYEIQAVIVVTRATPPGDRTQRNATVIGPSGACSDAVGKDSPRPRRRSNNMPRGVVTRPASKLHACIRSGQTGSDRRYGPVRPHMAADRRLAVWPAAGGGGGGGGGGGASSTIRSCRNTMMCWPMAERMRAASRP
jgi:hypothetical protein